MEELLRVCVGMDDVMNTANLAAALHGKGHFARAAQKYADAAAAVRALDADPDNLVVARLQTLQMSSLGELSQAPGADRAAALRTRMVDLLPDALAALERRRTAGTLAAARDRPVEVLWEVWRENDDKETVQQLVRAYVQEVRGQDARGGAATHVSAGVGSAPAQPLGKTAYLWAASYAAVWLFPPSQCAFPLTPQGVHALLAFILHAVDMVLEPRAENSAALAAEALFLGNLRVQVEQYAQLMHTTQSIAAASGYMVVCAAPEACADAALQLQAAWRRVLDSGVLRTRGIDDVINMNVRESHERAAAAAVSALAHGLRDCALPECGAREVHAKQFRMCSACHGAVYCGHEHQQLHWRAHKAACKAARAAAEAEPEAEAQQ
jgi:hypothetical protein